MIRKNFRIFIFHLQLFIQSNRYMFDSSPAKIKIFLKAINFNFDRNQDSYEE